MTRQDRYADRSPQHVGIVDIIMLAVVAAGAYLITGNFGGATPAFAGPVNADETQAQQICSDEELRHMRSGPETCFVPISVDKHEFSLEPSLNGNGAGTRNAGRQPATK